MTEPLRFGIRFEPRNNTWWIMDNKEGFAPLGVYSSLAEADAIEERWNSGVDLPFEELAEVYEGQTMVMSSVHMMQRTAAFERIEADGLDAVPSILKRVEAGNYGMHWQYLLHAITGEHPTDEAEEEVEGGGFVAIDVHRSAELWLAWGRERGYLS